ncbi:polysaccharide biosynthesis protein GumK [Roseibium denhamense]|uniref:GumK N-terminal domain-containing glycosyltransferase n=1 Tax=Roseibium denhamense TaxID=76305 RepID=UPI0012BD6F2E|nr:polysaccharide biosynthesis protein GumK [Roseibium denhamense]MTI05560.1 polysaccharide biosynthesis protein GumK [Roseibium denhamense]
MTLNIVFISRHDYRTGWKAGIHFIADAVRNLGHKVRFVSVGFSPLSMIAEDHRKPLYGKANRWETVDNIDCYLWQSPIHPFGKGLGRYKRLTNFLFRWWIRSPCKALDQACREADLIVVQSGVSATLAGRARRHAPKATIVYLASDLLETIDAHPYIARQLFKDRKKLDTVAVISRPMAPHLEYLERPIVYLPQGILKSRFKHTTPSPFTAERNIVTVGSMLFDEAFFKAAAPAFPDIVFHHIGTPEFETDHKNIVFYGRLPFEETLPYLKHANAGIAPYLDSDNTEYLADSSLKLAQYEFLKLPAVCPHFAVGGRPSRHGYTPGDAPSIVGALQNALSTPFEDGESDVLDWCDVGARVIEMARQRT